MQLRLLAFALDARTILRLTLATIAILCHLCLSRVAYLISLPTQTQILDAPYSSTLHMPSHHYTVSPAAGMTLCFTLQELHTS